MDQVQTYADLKNQKLEADLANKQKLQQGQVAQQGLNDYKENAVLNQYVANQQGNAQPQGLGSVQNTDVNASDYTRIATQVANSVPDQATYSKMIVKGAIDGKLDPNAVIKDNNVSEEDKMILMSLLQGGPQNEQPPIGLNPR